jgi:hypothetical protein
MTPFSEEEIKKNEVWDCEILREIFEFLSQFHPNGCLVKGNNSSFITLMPKKVSLVSEKYRLIVGESGEVREKPL